MRAVKVRVPATTANLGPGFDCLGMAVTLYNEVELIPDATGGYVEVTGPLRDGVATDKTNLVYRCAERLLKQTGDCGSFNLRMELRSPLARGMGSSASAIVAGMVVANAASENPLDEKRLLLEMCLMEGHPDNVVPCYLGGLTASMMLEDSVLVQKYDVDTGWRFVFFVPEYELSTSKARQAIPSHVGHKDAVFNVSRIPHLVAALIRGEAEYLDELMDDRLHQPFRKQLIRGYDALLTTASNSGAASVCLSGAGPTMLAVCREDSAPAVAKAWDGLSDELGIPGRTMVLEVDTAGARIESSMS